MESIILSSWDHIMGPQIEKLWLVNSGDSGLSEVSKNILFDFNISKHYKSEQSSSQSNLSEMKIYSIMCGQLMLGEVDSCKPLEQWVSRFYVSEYKIVVAVVFRQKNWTSFISSKKVKDACLCFATIFKQEELSFVLNNQEIIDLHLRKGVNIIRNSEITFDEVIKNVDGIATELASLIFFLHKSNLQNPQMPCPSLQDFLNLEIICRAIVSHFKTVGCTVVLGSSDFAINQVISVLCSFNSRKELQYSLAYPHTSKAYIQSIHIQGVMKDTNKESENLLEQAARELFPLTVVDVDLGKVWQTIPVKNSDNTYKNSVSLVEEKGYLVPELLKDLKFIQETGGDFKPLIKNFCNYLMNKSATIIKMIEQTSGCGVSLNTNELQSMLNVPCMVDLQILFGCAERLKPGIRSTVI